MPYIEAVIMEINRLSSNGMNISYLSDENSFHNLKLFFEIHIVIMPFAKQRITLCVDRGPCASSSVNIAKTIFSSIHRFAYE